MGWMNRLLPMGVAGRADPLDETIINGEPYDPYRVAQKAAPAVGPEVEIPEEIKRRQTGETAFVPKDAGAATKRGPAWNAKS
jgi:hypothetical protein